MVDVICNPLIDYCSPIFKIPTDLATQADYTTIIGSYASIFELSVAMNFAYTASRPFRKAMKDGFLHNIKAMESWYDEKRIEVSGMIMLLTDVDEEAKAKIKQDLDESLLSLKQEDEKLHNIIIETQSKIADEIKPIYIYTALFSLIMLFLGGQEAVHNRFPKEGIQILLISTLFFYIGSSISKRFFNSIVSAYEAVIFAGMITVLVLFVKYDHLSKFICNKYLLDIALVVAFLPFMISAIRLSLLNIKISLSANKNYNKIRKKLLELKENAEAINKGKEYFKKNGSLR